MTDRTPRTRSDADHYGVIAMTFVERMSTLNSKTAVCEAFADAMADFGLDYFIMVDLPRPTGIPNVLVTKPPIGWTELYLGNGYQAVDPVFDRCRIASQPFEWKEIVPPTSKRQEAEAFMNLAGDFGLVEGLSIPIHNHDGTSSVVSLSATKPYLNSFTKPAIHLMSIYAFDQARQLSAHEAWTGPALSKRELEVLTWASIGKSASSIADILNISERTAIAHTANAMNKLGATNRTHAVAIALRRRLINI